MERAEIGSPAVAIMETIELEFAHQKISVRMTGDADTNREVLALVRARLGDAEAAGSGKLPSHLVAVRGLFALAEEYVEAKRRFEAYRAEIAECLPPSTPAH